MTVPPKDKKLEMLQNSTPVDARRDTSSLELSAYAQVAPLLHVSPEEIIDMYKCTPMQEALISLFTKGSEAHVKRVVLSLNAKTDLAKLRSAVDDAVKATPLLRTRIVHLDGLGFLQVVLSKTVEWSEATSFDDCLNETKSKKWGIGDPLVRYTLVKDDQGMVRWFVWAIHHALYDGWSFPHMVNQVCRRYDGFAVEPAPEYKHFVQHIALKNQNEAKEFWTSALSGTRYTTFPALPERSYTPAADTTMDYYCPPVPRVKGVTRTALLRGAWALIMNRLHGSEDAVFGTIVSGRREPFAGIQSLMGPTVATIPVRVRVDGGDGVDNYLEAMEDQVRSTSSFAQFGLHQIAQVSSDARQACSFQTLLVVQPGEDTHVITSEVGDWKRLETDVGRSSYALTIQCFLNKDGIRMVAIFDSTVLDSWRAQKMLEQFSFVTQLLAEPSASRSVADVAAAMSPQDLADIWGWNSFVPAAEETCVHDLISQTATTQPDALAVCAWDGSFTYREVDDLSNRLAHHLVNQRLTPESMMPLCFEKSKWTTVAMLGVMKAGGVSIAMDTTQPEDRLRSIVGHVSPRLMLSSSSNRSMARRIGECDVVVVSQEALAAMETPSVPTLPTVHPRCKLMVLFTSGSTGSPKGAVITHSSFASAIKHHGPVFGIGPGERIYDFASYSFDIAWFNVLQSLCHGACLCVPSEADRKDDLEASIARFSATVLFLTPSVARLLRPESLPQVRCVALGGEPQKWIDFQAWPAHVRKLSVYGPAECTVVSSAADASILQRGDMFIGRGLASANWIMTTSESPTLAPVGTVGELWLEGPLVGHGYIGRRSGEAFVQDPPWLLQGCPGNPGRRGRLYKTGDLVRYNADGTLAFAGRKDNQVKIRGQRVELGEIEHHIRRNLDDACRPRAFDGVVVAEVIVPQGSGNPALVAFVHPGTTYKGTEATESEQACAKAVRQLVNGLDERLAEALPSYMVPNAFIPLRQVPMTNNGKTDRRRLREMGRTAFSPDALRTEQANKVAPTSHIEKMLVEAWAEVLNMRPDDISTDVSFLRIGGDSITAMQVISRCRTRGTHLTVGELLREQTIQRVAALSTRMASSLPCSTDAEPQGVVWELSPIQRMFFELHPDGLHHFNQGFLLKMREMVPNDAVRAALQAVVSRHSMLRARFRRNTGGDWGQAISGNSPDAFAFSEHAVQSMEEVDRLVQARHRSLDISTGPVFAADLFTDAQGTQFLFLAAHHLVVDLVSWRVLWHDIERLIQRGETLAHRTTSFHTWCGLQRDEATSLSLDQVLPLAFNEPDLEFWGMSALKNTHEGTRHFGTHLDVETTRLLLGKSNQAFGTEITDVLVAALAHSFKQAFPGRQPPPVHLEGHGREPLGQVEVDLSETVGWFTTMHPLQIPMGPNQDIIDSVRIAKDIRRRVPGKGRPYFNHRYTAAKSGPGLGEHSIPELTLNFTGVYQQLEKQNGLFQLEDRSGGSGRSLSMAGDAKRFCLVEVIVGVAKGRMAISFGVHQDMSHQPQLEAWKAGFAHQLRAAARSLSGRPASLTPGDFPLLPLACDELDRLMDKTLPEASVPVHTVRDMYPCTPLQEGILFSISKGTATYANLFVWECVAEGQGPVSPVQLEAAWRSVVAHHAILSTVFIERLDVGDFIQVLLRNQSPRLSLILSGSRQPADALREQKRPSFTAGEPQHALTICQASDGGVACRLDITHALIDAASVQILMGDLSKAYAGRCLPAHAPFAKFVQHTTQVPKPDSIAFWTKLLVNVQECYFPSGHAGAWSARSRSSHAGALSARSRSGQGRITVPSSVTSHLHAFCQSQGITRSVLIQVAWALVLSQYTGSRDVCFGYLASSRDIPVKGIDNTVGPLINVLIGRIDLDDTARRVVATTFARSVDQLVHQHGGLAEMHRKLGPLFNTAMTVRESRQHDKHQEGPVSFHEVESEDPDEFDVTLVAGINGASTDISLVYQNALLSPDTARGVAGVMCDAIGYLLSINLEASTSGKVEHDDRPLYDAFFTYRTGFHEDAAVEFWEKEFQGSEAPQFPSLPSPSHRPCLDGGISHHVCGLVWPKSGFTLLAMITAAWAILAARYANSDEATFAVFVAQRPLAHRPGLWGTGAGEPSTNTAAMPIRVILEPDWTVDKLLDHISRKQTDMEHFGRIVPQGLFNISEELKRACQYQTFLVVGSEAPEDSDASGFRLSTDGAKGECALVVRCQTQQEGLRFLIDFDSAVLDKTQVVRVAHQLEHILRQISTCGDQRQLRAISVASPLDLRDIWLRNAVAPEPVLACVHDLIVAAARRRPDAPAICAWDGELTHQQLDALSTRLAQQLIQLGIARGTSICLCFEKSVWTPVAILGVVKAGAVSVNLDISQPEDRLRAIVGEVAPRLILSSRDQSSLANRLGPFEVVTVGKELENLDPSTAKLPSVNPDDDLYIVFTSGSTGTPKGVMITHGNFCSAIRHQQALGFRSTSRVYDFASYAFDVSWSNLLHTLAAGGCLCVPSDQDRKQDLAKSMCALGANYVDLTPTVAQLLSTSKIPQLKTLNLGGEALVPGTFDHWPDDIRIINAYGPAECTVVSTYTEVGRAKQDRGIGTALGTVAWVVDPDGDRLAAVGTVGELWIEGPLVARGYLHNAERNAQAFVRDPPWLLRGTAGYPGRRGRLYRTGDLVRCNPDGSLCYLGRADTQVKINGQRVELGDIEHHIRRALSTISPDFDGIVVAEVVHPLGSDHPVLLAFLGPCNQPSESEAARHDNVDNTMLRRITLGLNERLAKVLPPHMIPSAYVSARDISMTAAAKVDRRRIRQTYASLKLGQIAGLGPAPDERRRPQTWQQRQLQSLWARVLGLDTDRIGLDDNFFRMGGDSVGAMKLVGAAREQSLSLTVVDIFAHPDLEELAGLLLAKEEDDVQVSICPFSLLGAAVDTDGAVRKAASLCGIAPEQVEDMFRCTPLQEGLLAMTARRSGDYVAQFVYKLPADVDLGCFVEAWTLITANAPILRTRIVNLKGAGLFQVVTKGQIPWKSGHSVGEHLEQDKQQPMGLGTALTRLALVTSPSSGQVHFVWTIHHAVYDGWSMPLMLEAVDGAYRGQSLPAWTPFQRFAQHVDSVDGQAAADFWRTQFEGSDAPQFPLLPSRNYHPAADSGLHHEIQGLEWVGSDFTASTLIRTAWAIVIARHTAVDEAIFGATVTGRQAAVQGIDLVIGPTFATVPVRVPIDWAASLEDVLRKVQHQAIQMIPFEQLGLQTIRVISDDAERSCNFQTLLVVQPDGKAADNTSLFCQPTQGDKPEIDAFATNALVIECLLRNRGMHLRVSFDSAVVQQAEAERLAQQFEHMLRQLCCPESRRASISGLDMMSDKDLERIWQWNGALPPPVDSSVQELLAETFGQQPSMPAICAWDGELTYRELDVLSTRLARHLVKELRVGPEVVVPLLFEKSKWMPVSMLATIKAGGVSVAIDPSQPEHISQRIVDQVDPSIILSSSSQELRAKRLGHGCKVVRVYDGLRAIANDDNTDLPKVGPDKRLYIVFTSGSTGLPKGATITHGNFCSAMRHQQSPLGYTSECRVFDFASYAFDAAWSNLLYTLLAGGCVCIPSELERKRDLAGSIRRLKATYLDLTPSVAELLSGSDVPLVNHVVLGGEGLTEAAYSHWPEHVRLTNTYGPAECTINSTSTPIRSHGKHQRGIGTGIGTVTWVVANDGQLAPIGAIGELWLEGPIVGPGYFNMPTQTRASFAESPTWLLEGRRDGLSGRCGRLYKTGDLVRYNADGSLAFIGRKDTQVKIRGQRVELTAIEDYVHQLLRGEDSDRQDAFQGTFVAEVVTPRDREQPVLVLFIHLGDAHAGTEQENMEAVRRVAAPLAKRLADSAPLYMLPSAFLPLQSVPKLSSEKVDRRQLRAIISSLTWEEMAARNVLTTSRGARRAPESRQQRRMQTLWAQVLNLDAESIGLDDSFLHLGGDSIKAMRLAAAAREEGLLLHVADILRHPNLDELADCAKVDHDQCEQDIPPFSLLGANVDEAAIRAHAVSLCRKAQIHDIFPCTPLQAGLFALSMQQKGGYIARFVHELRPDVDVSRFTEAWDHAVEMSPILRTRFVQLPGREICQVVVAKHDQDDWLSGDDIDAYIQEDRRRTMGLGEPLSRTGLVRAGKSGKIFFIWTIHHALYDGWSLTLLFDMVMSHYERGSSPAPVPFQAFVKHLASIDDGLADAYWEREFEKLETQIFPVLPSSAYTPRANQSLRHQIQPLGWSQTNFTASAVIRLAWGILAAKRSATSDAVFGALVSGRQAPVAGIERVLAPTIATVPVRIAVGWDQTVGAMLRKVQNQAADMVPFEQTGLQQIRRVSQGASLACRFQTLLVVHPAQVESENLRLFAPRQTEVDEEAEAMINFSTYALTVQCQLEERGMRILASFDSSVVQESVVSRLLQQYEHILRQVLDASRQMTQVRDMCFASAEDLNDLWRWNASLPAPANRCINDLIADMTRQQPLASAIEAWDGTLTYQQLDDLSDQLAHNLRELGVGPEVTVPLCFEKTMWMPVAMLGVLKAGGVFVPVDVGQAQDRARMVLAAIRPIVIVTSTRYRAFAQQEGCPTVQPQYVATRGAQRPKPSSADVGLTPHSGAYVIFTSGSTGTPKGVVMEHGAASTSLVAHGAELGLNQTTRFLQFASYAFDACIMEILTNLVYGGCICIPSDESRLERLAESMNEMRVSTMFATPSVARLIRPDEVPTLRTLAMGGEQVSTTDTARWAHLPRLLNVYGPTECAVICVMQLLTGNIVPSQTIGKPIGCAAWVVDPSNPDSLVPIGAVGELLIEGHLLARGYLDDEARTQAAFVESPPWLTQYGRCGHLYKTGDLVRYNPNGTLVYVGRKDNQVKINGQRVELGEVEHHVRQLLTSSYPGYRGGVELAAEVIKPRDTSQPMLVVFIYPAKASFQSADECAAQVRQMVAGLDERLTGVLPAHMIPGAYIALESAPITATGKMDRRHLRAKGSSFTTSDLASMSTQSTLPKRLPATQVQRTLAQIWARVLNITTEIGLDDNFFSLGGDSISAMQVSAAARSQGLQIPTRDLKLRKTIAKLASSLQVQPRETRPLIARSTAESGDRFRLSPIQQYHFETRPEGPDWADLPFYLGITRRVATQLIIDALHRLVGRHPMLRARFCPDETGVWVQYVCKSTQDSLLFKRFDTTSLSQTAATIAECRASIDIENGPSLVAALFEDDGQQTLFLTAHHLVIDFVSWRLIFQDLEELLTGGDFASSPVTSFQEWCRLQRDYAAENLEPEGVLNHVPYQPPPNYWATDDAVPGKEVYTRKHFYLDMPTSSAILGPCSARLQVRPHELMMGALSYSFSRVFQDRSVPPIFTEGHGREAWDESIDLSQTVGWFTTVFPVQIDASEDDGVLDFVFKTRKSLLNTPRQGWSYFASKYLNERGREAFSKDRMEINFNFLGQFQQLERESSLLQAVKLPDNCRPPGMAPIDTVGVLDVVIFIERGQVYADLKYNSRVRHQDKIETWMQTFERTLVDMVRSA